MGKILHIVLNNYEFDNRVRRSANSGYKLGLDTCIFALSKFDKKIYHEEGVKVFLFYLITRNLPKKRLFQLLKYLEMFIKMIISGIKYRPNIVHAHDLNALPIAFIISKTINAKLIYDSHEFWIDSGYFGAKNKIIETGIRILEGFLIKRVDLTITVSTSIALLLKKEHKILLPSVIRNLPEKWTLSHKKKLRKNLKIKNETIIVLYQGVITGKGVYDLINSFKTLNNNAALVFLGNGPEVINLKKMKITNVYFHPSVSYKELPYYTSDADIGVHSMHGDKLNTLNALPNKLFEYIQGGLALIISDLPEMSRVVNDYKLGLTYKYGKTILLKECLSELIKNKVLREKYKSNSMKSALSLNWDEESRKLNEIYKNLLDRKS